MWMETREQGNGTIEHQERELTDEQGPRKRAVVTKLSQGEEEPVEGKRE